jgi:hypothetical protein
LHTLSSEVSLDEDNAPADPQRHVHHVPDDEAFSTEIHDTQEHVGGAQIRGREPGHPEGLLAEFGGCCDRRNKCVEDTVVCEEGDAVAVCGEQGGDGWGAPGWAGDCANSQREDGREVGAGEEGDEAVEVQDATEVVDGGLEAPLVRFAVLGVCG